MNRDKADPLVLMFNEQSDFPIEEDDIMTLYEYTRQEHPDIQDKQQRVNKAMEYIPLLKELKQEEEAEIAKAPISMADDVQLQ